VQALQPKNLFTTAAGQYAFGPSLTVPIFEGGQLRAT
jgi:outer membrane protein TolC